MYFLNLKFAFKMFSIQNPEDKNKNKIYIWMTVSYQQMCIYIYNSQDYKIIYIFYKM